MIRRILILAIIIALLIFIPYFVGRQLNTVSNIVTGGWVEFGTWVVGNMFLIALFCFYYFIKCFCIPLFKHSLKIFNFFKSLLINWIIYGSMDIKRQRPK